MSAGEVTIWRSLIKRQYGREWLRRAELLWDSHQAGALGIEVGCLCRLVGNGRWFLGLRQVVGRVASFRPVSSWTWVRCHARDLPTTALTSERTLAGPQLASPTPPPRSQHTSTPPFRLRWLCSRIDWPSFTSMLHITTIWAQEWLHRFPSTA